MRRATPAVTVKAFRLVLAALAIAGAAACDNRGKTIHACDKDLHPSSGVRDYADGLASCLETGRRALSTSFQLSSEQLRRMTVGAPTLAFERKGGLNFTAGIGVPALGVDFSLTNNAAVPISSVTYEVVIVGDGELIASAQLTDRLAEALMPGHTARITAPIEVSGVKGDLTALLRSRQISTSVRLLKAS